MTTYAFQIVVEPDEEHWRAYSAALEAQGADTWGYTREEALQNIREVLEMIVEEGKPVPAGAAVSEEPLVAVTGSSVSDDSKQTLVQYCLPGAGRDPRPAWIPAFAGKTIGGFRTIVWRCPVA